MVKGRRCRAKFAKTLLYSVLMTVLYTGWFYAILFTAHFISRLGNRFIVNFFLRKKLSLKKLLHPDVEDGSHIEREHLREDQSPDYGKAEGLALLSAGT